MKKVLSVVFLFILNFSIFSQANVNQQIEHAEELYSLYHFDEALQILNEVLLENPDNMYAMMDRSCVYDALGEYEKALKDINKVVEYNPNMLKARHIRGGIYCNIGNYDKAIEEENLVLKSVPYFESGLNVRGLAYGKSGKYEEAEKDFSSAISAAQNKASSPEIYLLNRAYIYYFQKQYDKCLNDLELALSYSKANPETLALKSRVLRLQGSYKESIEWVSKAIKCAPDYFELYYLRILNYFEENDLESAKNDLDYVESNMEESSAFHTLKALYYFLMNDVKSMTDEISAGKRLEEFKSDSFLIQIVTDEIENEIRDRKIEIIEF